MEKPRDARIFDYVEYSIKDWISRLITTLHVRDGNNHVHAVPLFDKFGGIDEKLNFEADGLYWKAFYRVSNDAENQNFISCIDPYWTERREKIRLGDRTINIEKFDNTMKIMLSMFTQVYISVISTMATKKEIMRVLIPKFSPVDFTIRWELMSTEEIKKDKLRQTYNDCNARLIHLNYLLQNADQSGKKEIADEVAKLTGICKELQENLDKVNHGHIAQDHATIEKIKQMGELPFLVLCVEKNKYLVGDIDKNLNNENILKKLPDIGPKYQDPEDNPEDQLTD